MTPETSNLERLRLTLEAMQVRRFHAAPQVKAQPVGQHSIGVLFIAIYICGGAEHTSKDILLECVTHDQQEIFTGDIPFHAKRDSPKLRELSRELEALYNPQFLVHGLDLTPREHLIVKLADQLDGMFWTLFNENGNHIFNAWKESLRTMFLSNAYEALLDTGEKARTEELYTLLINPPQNA